MLILRTLNQIKLQSHPILSGRTNTSLNWNLKESCDLKKNPNMYPKHTSHSNLAAEIHSIMGNRQSLIGYYLNCVFLAGYVQIRVNDCGNTSRHQVPACHYNLLTESDRWQADHITGFSFSGGKGKKKKIRREGGPNASDVGLWPCIWILRLKVSAVQQLALEQFNGGGEHMVLKQIPGGTRPSLGASQLSLTVTEDHFLLDGSTSVSVLYARHNTLYSDIVD